MLYVNNQSPSSICRGVSEVSRVYRGKNLVWEKELFDFYGKFAEGTTEEDWYWNLDLRSGNVTASAQKVSVAESVDPASLNFKFNEPTDVNKSLGSFLFSGSKIEQFKISRPVSINSCNQWFQNCKYLKSVDLSGAKLYPSFKSRSYANLFNGCSSMEEIDCTKLHFEVADSLICAFKDCTNLKEIDLSAIEIPNNANFDRFIYGCSSLEKINFGKIDFSNSESTSIFGGNYALSQIRGEISGLHSDIKLGGAPLDYESVNILINALAPVTKSTNLTLKYSAYRLISELLLSAKP